MSESLVIPDPDRHDLMEALRSYVLEARDSNDAGELVAVGAAIRKYVAMLPASQLGQVATLLDAGHRAGVPLAVELEVAKMVFRKFEANPPASADPEPALAERLAEIADLYARPRLAARETYGAVAMLAAQATAVMRSGAWRRVLAVVNELGPPWFRTQLARRLSHVAAEWRARAPEAADDLAARVAAIAAAA